MSPASIRLAHVSGIPATQPFTSAAISFSDAFKHGVMSFPSLHVIWAFMHVSSILYAPFN
jgi:hypothetical protein